MRKMCFAAMAAFLAFACAKPEYIGEQTGRYALEGLKFEISVDNPESKAPKTAWTEGDRINIWFDDDCGQDSPDLVISYSGGSWVKSAFREGATASASGTLAALYESGNSLGAMGVAATASGVTYSVPASKHEGGLYGCSPMIMTAQSLGYSLNTSTNVLTANISGWTYRTRFKVLVKSDPAMDKSADSYALKVSRESHPLKSIGLAADGTSVAFTPVSNDATWYAGGVQESDGIAFYFDSMSCSGQKVSFVLKEHQGSTLLYTTPSVKTFDATSATACTGVSLAYSSFGPAAAGSLEIEDVLDGGTVDVDDTQKEEYTLTNVTYYYYRYGADRVAPSRTVDGMNWMCKVKFNENDRWGGSKDLRPTSITSSNPAGFWRTGTYNGKKVFVDPDGNVALLMGMNTLLPEPMQDSPSEPGNAYYYDKFGQGETGVQNWASWCCPRLAELGFNSYNVSPSRFRKYRNNTTLGFAISETTENIMHAGDGQHQLSQIENLFLLRTFYWDYKNYSGKSFKPADQSEFTLMFDPDFVGACQNLVGHAATGCGFRNNPNFIGYYLDNELPHVEATSTYPKVISLQEFINLPTDSSDPGYYRCNSYAKAWALEWMQNTYGTTTYSASMEPAFVKEVARYYYRTLCGVIRAIDGNHLILGDRLVLASAQTQGIIEACAEYCDVVTFNFYRSWDATEFPNISSYSAWLGDKPMMATEFYTKNRYQKHIDGTTYSNQEGAGWQVYSQRDRGLFYQNACIRFIENPNFAGWQHFKWGDDYRPSINPPGWVNKGIVLPDYSGFFTDFTDLMQQLNFNAYRILDYYY